MDYILGILLFAGMFWMIWEAIKNQQIWWALGMFFLLFPCFIYGLLHWDKASKPYLLFISSIFLGAIFIE